MPDVARGPGGAAQCGELVLASSSPRRRELMAGLGIGFRAVAPSVSEDLREGEPAEATVERLALLKAKSVAGSLSSGLVIGADSVVVMDGRILGKPRDVDEATEMLTNLRGREHLVATGVAMVDALQGKEVTSSQVSVVTMREYSSAEMEAYMASGEPMDKAGAYAVQDRVFRPAARWEGCYPNVIGLPLCLLVDLLKTLGCDIWPGTEVSVPEGCWPCPLKAAN